VTACTVLAQQASAIKTAVTAIAAADSTIYEFCTHLDAQNQVILFSLATTVPGGRGMDRYTFTQVAVAGPGALAAVRTAHRANRVKHLAMLATAATKGHRHVAAKVGPAKMLGRARTQSQSVDARRAPEGANV
jgi:hypothetical protein